MTIQARTTSPINTTIKTLVTGPWAWALDLHPAVSYVCSVGVRVMHLVASALGLDVEMHRDGGIARNPKHMVSSPQVRPARQPRPSPARYQ